MVRAMKAAGKLAMALAASLALLSGFQRAACQPEVVTPEEVVFATASLAGTDLILTENGSLSMLPSDAADLPTSDVSAVVDLDDGHCFALIGSGAIALEPVMASLLGTMPATPSLAPAPDTHPKQPTAKFQLKKEWKDEKGRDRVRFATLEVEKRSGERPEEHLTRAERELEKWEDAGWVSVPAGSTG